MDVIAKPDEIMQPVDWRGILDVPKPDAQTVAEMEQPSPAQLLHAELARAEEIESACLMPRLLLEMRSDVTGTAFRPGDSGIVAIQLGIAREHALALAEEIAEVLETSRPTNAFRVDGAQVGGFRQERERQLQEARIEGQRVPAWLIVILILNSIITAIDVLEFVRAHW